MLQGGLCFRNLVGPLPPSGLQVLKDICLSQGIFLQALILFLSGEHILPFPKESHVSSFSGDVLGNILMTSRQVMWGYQ